MFEFSAQSLKYQTKLNEFMDEHIFPNEHTYAEQLVAAENRFAPLPIMDDLKSKAKAAGLWNLYVPPSLAEF